VASARTCATLALTLATANLAAGCGGADSPDTGEMDVVADDAAAEDAAALPAVHITEPADGAELSGDSVRVMLHAENVVILPAGDTTPNSGHHHLLLNAELPATGEAIPVEVDGVVHLGQAQTEYTFTDLEPGEYTLVAVMGDLVHRVLNQVTDTVRFTVVPPQ